MDYPEFGFNTNWVVITDNDFIGNNVTEDIWVCNRANLYSGTLGTTNRFTDNNAFSWAPALTYGTAETTEYLMQGMPMAIRVETAICKLVLLLITLNCTGL